MKTDTHWCWVLRVEWPDLNSCSMSNTHTHTQYLFRSRVVPQLHAPNMAARGTPHHRCHRREGPTPPTTTTITTIAVAALVNGIVLTRVCSKGLLQEPQQHGAVHKEVLELGLLLSSGTKKEQVRWFFSQCKLLLTNRILHDAGDHSHKITGQCTILLPWQDDLRT